MSGDNTKLGEAGPFTAGPCDIGGSRDEERIGAAVFSGDGQPFVLIDPDTVVGGDALPRAEAIARLLNGMGWDGVALLAEAAQLFRDYEEGHREKVAIAQRAYDAADDHTRMVKNLKGAIGQARAKAERNGQFADRIERWLAGDDLLLIEHPVEALRQIAVAVASGTGMQVDHAAFDAARVAADAEPAIGEDAKVPEAVEDQRLRRYGAGCPTARAAVDEALGPDGPGPFPSGTGLTRGGRAESMPVCHSEEAGVDRG